MERVLVTGASGRVGANLVKTLIEKGYVVRSMVYPGDPRERKLTGLDTEIVYADFRDVEAVDRAVDGMDTIAHVGFLMGRPRGQEGIDRSGEFDINIRGTFNVLEAARRRIDKIERFLFAGSVSEISVHNALPSLPVNEEYPLNPCNFYGVEKVICERMGMGALREYGLPFTSVRYDTPKTPNEVFDAWWRAGDVSRYLKSYGTRPGSAVYVEGIDRPWEAIDRAVEDPEQYIVVRNLEGKPWIGHVTDVRDVVAGTVLALERDEAIGQIFGIGAPSIRLDEAVRCICDKTGKSYVDVQIPNYWAWECDYSKARNLLGFEAKYTFADIVDSALAMNRGEDIGVIPNF